MSDMPKPRWSSFPVTILAVLGLSMPVWAADGDLDISFDGDGKVTTPMVNGTARAMTIDSQGRTVIVGNVPSNREIANDTAVGLVRYNPDGSLDTTFGEDGIVTVLIGAKGDVPTDVTIDPVGKIVVVGRTYKAGQSQTDFFVTRILDNGSTDSTFGPRITPIGDSNDNATGVALQADGKIVVAGTSHNTIMDLIAVARYKSTGELDETFSADGKLTVAFDGSSSHMASSVAIGPDGKIVVAGSASFAATSFDFAVLRFRPDDGTLDSTFDGDGRLTTTLGSRDDYAQDVMIVDTQGRLIVVGWSLNDDSKIGLVMARYLVDGRLDSTFDLDGIVRSSLTPDSLISSGLALDANARILVSGSSKNDMLIQRYLPTGALDQEFGTGGMVWVDFASKADGAVDLVLQKDQKIVVAGQSESDWAAARLFGEEPPPPILPPVTPPTGEVTESPPTEITPSGGTRAVGGGCSLLLERPFLNQGRANDGGHF